MKIKIKKTADVKTPNYAHPSDAGMDIYSSIECLIKPGERKLISAGFKMALPIGYEAQVRPKSGLAAKHGITVINSPGTIDANYRGDVGVLLINHGSEEFKVEKNSKIAQIVINKIENFPLEEVEELDDTDRGEKGFGSTGLH